MKQFLSFAFLLLHLAAFSQNKVATIIDANTGEAIPYANIKIGTTSNNVSNADGKFNLPASLENETTKIEISYIGYETQQITFAQLENQNFVIKLAPGIYELNNVNVSDKKEDVAAIMAKVKANLKENYGYYKKDGKITFFLRTSTLFSPEQIDVEIDQSTGFTKTNLKEINKEVAQYVSKMMQSPPKEFKDFLGEKIYGSDIKDGKNMLSQKIAIKKATMLRDENRSVSIENLELTAGKLFLKHLDTTKFYRVKSGLFGSRDTISFSQKFRNEKRKKEGLAIKNNLSEVKSDLLLFESATNPEYSRSLTFMKNIDWYKYSIEEVLFDADYKLIYVINFKPDKSKGKFEGKLYVSENDYAVVNATYKLAKGKTLGGINLKWILGIKSFENVSYGTLIYKKNPETEKYHLQYANQVAGNYFYVNRPIKFIEITDDDKDVLALNMKVEGNTLNKKEYLSINETNMPQANFADIRELDFNFLKIKKYDPKIYREFTTIEPAEEMKQFSIGVE